jgi:hypothetical protein
MNASSPYGPDHSLLHAVFVLLGGLGLVAVGAYLVSALDVSSSQLGRAGLSDVQAPRSEGAQRSALSGRRGGQRLQAPAPVGGSVPSWAGSGDGAAAQMARAPQGRYEVDPDFGAADLGAPGLGGSGLGAPSAPAGAPLSGGRAVADAGTPGDAPQAGSAPLTPDLGGGSSGGRSFGGSATGGDAPQWRSGAQALASRSRALSGALGRIDRQGSREASRSRSETAEGDPSGEATTASGTGHSSASDPGTPEEPPQVPLGGAEWLAAAGAAYALNRLREEDGDEEESGDDA